MAVYQVYQFAAVIPAGTPVANPVVVPMPMPDLSVEWMEWKVPAGPRGYMGFWIGSHGQQMIPFASGGANWVVTDDEKAHWDMTGYTGGNDWELRGYNLGTRAHTVYVRWGLAVPPSPVPAFPAPINPAVLSSTGPGA